MTTIDTVTAAGVAAAHPQLIQLSRDLYDHPETAWEEALAQRVAGQLSDNGFHVTQRYCDIDTAFAAQIGGGDLHIALCAEYDALPGLGHACGHNLISAITVGAALALAPVVDDLGLTLTVIGTPAEEGGGGKIELLERNGFSGQHAAAQWSTRPRRRGPGTTVCRVAQPHRIPGEVRPRRRLPERGINAADAFTIAQVAIGLLRQQLPSSVRVRHDDSRRGGPERHRRTHRGTLVRARRDAHRIGRGRTPGHALLRSRRTGLGAVLTVTPESKPYAEFRTDEELLACYERRATAAGRRFSSGPDAMMARASTDMGNVSQTLPAIHPYIGIDSLPAVNHQPEFAAATITAAAETAIAQGAPPWPARSWMPPPNPTSVAGC